MHRSRSTLILATALLALGCGGEPGSKGGSTASEGEAASGGTPEQRAQAAVHEVVETCRQEDWAAAAPHFVYRGDDASRAWKDTWDPEDEMERLRAKSGCDGLLYGAFPETDSAYELGEIFVEKESEGTWYVQELTFPEEPDAEPVLVALLEIDGRMVVGDVD